MSERPSCQQCAAFSALTKECRRHAPEPFPMQGVRPGDFQVAGIFPGVTASHWCLEFVAIKLER